jgi:flavin reductase (DIM6/NTAB) family NADH-FMN oxidoreductase RutF
VAWNRQPADQLHSPTVLVTSVHGTRHIMAAAWSMPVGTPRIAIVIGKTYAVS